LKRGKDALELKELKSKLTLKARDMEVFSSHIAARKHLRSCENSLKAALTAVDEDIKKIVDNDEL